MADIEPATNEEQDAIRRWRFEPGAETMLVRKLDARCGGAEDILRRLVESNPASYEFLLVRDEARAWFESRK